MNNENNVTNQENTTQENVAASGIKILQADLVKEKTIIDKLFGDFIRGVFWLINPAGEIEICHSWLLDYLFAQGFFNLDHGGSITLVWEKSPNIIIPTNIKVIKDHVRSFIESIDVDDIGNGASKDQLKQKLVKGIMNYICAPKLDMLPIKQIEFLKDTADTSYVFFKNCVAKVTADKIESVPYASLTAKVWGGKVKPDEFHFDPKYTAGSVIEQFFGKITGGQEVWFNSLRSHIGYLLSRYKPGHLSVLVAFIDRHIRNFWEANGGTGKSMIMKCIMRLRDVVRIDGKGDISYAFAFDTVTTWTDIVFIEDLKKEISIERFFVGITEATSVNRKYQQQLVLTDDDRPKYGVSSNYVLRMPVGAAAERRVREIEIDNYYNDKFTAFDDFKHEFFREWDADEHQRLFHFMLGCLQFYIKNSIVAAPNINKEYRRLLSHTGDDFIEFMDDYLCEKSGTVKIRKDETRELYRKLNPSQRYQHSSKNKFTSMMKKYFEYKQIPFEEIPKRTKKYFELQLPVISAEAVTASATQQSNNNNIVMSAEQAEKMFNSLENAEFDYKTIDTNE